PRLRSPPRGISSGPAPPRRIRLNLHRKLRSIPIELATNHHGHAAEACRSGRMGLRTCAATAIPSPALATSPIANPGEPVPITPPTTRPTGHRPPPTTLDVVRGYI